MTQIEDFIYQYEGNQRDVLLYFHQLLSQEYNLSCKMRYRIPFYYGKTWICYLNPTKRGTVELAFLKGHLLSNVQGLLDSKGRKQVCGIEFGKVEDIPPSAVDEIVQEAILLDKTKFFR